MVTWDAKTAAEVVERHWLVPVPDGDSVASVTTSASGVTVDSTDTVNSDIAVVLSAGTAGATGTVTITATTTDGLTLAETFYIAVRANLAQAGNTARDVCYFALRKITGNGENPDADEMDDALERLNDMVALWALSGVDIGISEPLEAGDTLALPDGYLAALKFNLRLACHSHYGVEPDGYDAMMADRAYRALEAELVTFDNVTMPATLRRRWAYYTGQS